MKTRTGFLIVTLASLLLATVTYVYSAEVFTSVTADKQVYSVDDVQVKATETVQTETVKETFYTLPKERERLADLEAKRDEINAQITAQEALIAKITTEANKVTLLKEDESPVKETPVE